MFQPLRPPLLQSFLQEFAFTEGSLAAEIERRNQRLADLQQYNAASPQGFAKMVERLPEMLARLVGVPDAAAAARQLRDEPMFCVETGAAGAGAGAMECRRTARVASPPHTGWQPCSKASPTPNMIWDAPIPLCSREALLLDAPGM